MHSEAVVLGGYAHETYLPCDLSEIVSHVRRKSITAKQGEKVGLKSDIHAIPFNRGYMLSTKSIVLFTNNLKPIFLLDGTHSLHDLCVTSEMKSCLEQLHFYNLLSFESNNGQLKLINIDRKYTKKYQDGNFVTFSLVPITVELDITNSCNFACIHCFRDSKTIDGKRVLSDRELSTKELLAVIDDCARIGVPKLLLMGGEPLLHPDYFYLLKHAKERGIRDVESSTNGWFINEETAPKIAKYSDNIQISIHGASASTHDSIVGKKGSWEHDKKAIKILKENNIKVIVSVTVLRENVKDILKMPALVKEWGADSIRFIALTSMGRGCLLKNFSYEEIDQIGKEIKELYETMTTPHFTILAGGFPPLYPKKNDATVYGCAAGTALLHITSNGDVNACGSIEGKYIGNIRESNILDLWHSPKLIEMRHPMNCDCNYRFICSGPCKADLG